jgi:hypothetical protein
MYICMYTVLTHTHTNTHTHIQKKREAASLREASWTMHCATGRKGGKGKNKRTKKKRQASWTMQCATGKGGEGKGGGGERGYVSERGELCNTMFQWARTRARVEEEGGHVRGPSLDTRSGKSVS